MREYFRKDLAVVTAILALVVIADGISNPILPLYLTANGISSQILGLMFAIASIGMAITEATWGWLTDRIGPKIPLITTTFICGLLVFSFTLTTHIPNLFVIFLFWGISRSAVFGPTRGYFGTHTPLLKKATFMAIISGIILAAGCFGNLPSGIIADAWGFQFNFYISFGICLVAGIVLLHGLKVPLWTRSKYSDVSPQIAQDYRPQGGASNHGAVAIQCLVAALATMGIGIARTFLPLLATQKVGLNASRVGIIFFIAGLVTVILAIPLGRLADTVGKKRMMIIGLLISSGSLAGVALAGSFFWLVILYSGFQMGILMFNSSSLALLSEKTLPQRQSTIMGIYGGAGEDTGLIAGQALGGFAWNAWGSGAFLIGTIASGLGAIICLGFVSAKPLNNLHQETSNTRQISI
jgi:MFS family permease